MLQKSILSTVFLLFVTTVFSQLYEVNLAEKIRSASHIVEGEVVRSHAYYGTDSEIYTAHEILVYKSFKGQNVPELLTVITLGGTVDYETTTWSHLLTLQADQVGIFFLEPTSRPLPTGQDLATDYYNVFASSQGFLRYSFENDRVTATAPFALYEDVPNDLYSLLRQSVGIPTIYKSAKWEKPETCIQYLFELSEATGSSSGINLDVKVSVRSNQGKFYLKQAAVIADYDPEILGENIITNGVLKIVNEGISASNAYLVNSKDFSSKQAGVEIKAKSGSFTTMQMVDTEYATLLSMKVQLSQAVDPGILFNKSSMTDNSAYVDAETKLTEPFSCIDIAGDFQFGPSCPLPTITNFTPTTISAGTQSVLTITGTCFGATQGSSKVEFTDANTGPTPVNWVEPLDGDYISWSDTEIKVWVPSVTKTSVANTAGTGKFRVNVSGVGTVTSSSNLTVPFSAINHATGAFSNPANQSLKMVISEWNGHGGQSIYYTGSFKTDAGAVAAFERALTNWRCTTLINYIIQDEADIPDLNRAGKIEYASLPTGTTTTLASTMNSSILPCVSPTNVFTGASRRRFVIQFNNNLNWHTSTNMPSSLPANTYDMESRAVHELGHAHLLNHSNNSGDLMYFTDVTPPYRRDIEPNDEAGGDYIVNLSVSPPASCPTAMTAVLPGNCKTLTDVVDITDQISATIELYPNPTVDAFFVHLENSAVSQLSLQGYLFDVLGQRMLHVPIPLGTTRVDINHLPQGIYLFALRYGGQEVRTYRIVKE